MKRTFSISENGQHQTAEFETGGHATLAFLATPRPKSHTNYFEVVLWTVLAIVLAAHFFWNAHLLP